MTTQSNFKIIGEYTDAVIHLPSEDLLDKMTRKQITELTNYKAFKGLKIVVMPDTHAGSGCVIGTTVDMNSVMTREGSEETGVIPNVIGVDIGCGVETVNLGPKRINYEHLDKFIHANIPAGFSKREVQFRFDTLPDVRRSYYKELEDEIDPLCERIHGLNKGVLLSSIGTLGGGNHFIEVGIADELDENGDLNRWLSLHSGSRNPGLKVASHYQKMAQRYWKECKNKIDKERRDQVNRLNSQRAKRDENGKTKKEISNEIKTLEESWGPTQIPPKAAEFLPLHLGGLNYLRDMKLMQMYAKLNREVMLTDVMNHLGREQCFIVRSVHNYINFEDNILRKGAIAAHKDVWVVIPMNMKRGVVIGKGLGNEDWNFSAPHGSGRTMSRKEARREIKLNEFEKEMKDVYSTCVDKNRIDEAPRAYKDADMVCRQIHGQTIQIIYNVRAEYNFKG
jgi:tRNA-splicing ligase RtcB